MHDDDDLTLFWRLRHLISSHRQPFYGPVLDPGFDGWFGGKALNVREYIRKYSSIGAGSLGDEYLTPWAKYCLSLRYRHLSPPRLPPTPMWWDQPDDQNMTLIEDRTKPKKSRFYRPAYWPGVFGVKPKKPRKPKKKKTADPPTPIAHCPAPKWDDDAPSGASVAFQCDGCKKVVNTHSRIFTEALDHADMIGWLLLSNGQCWCQDCKNRNQTAA